MGNLESKNRYKPINKKYYTLGTIKLYHNKKYYINYFKKEFGFEKYQPIAFLITTFYHNEYLNDNTPISFIPQDIKKENRILFVLDCINIYYNKSSGKVYVKLFG